MGNPAVEPIEAVGPVKSPSQQMSALHNDAQAQESRWQTALEDKNAVQKYSCYILVLNVINHLSLDKVDTQVIAESQMMDVEHDMQTQMIKISKFISEIQGESTGTVVYNSVGENPALLGPNAYLGLKSAYYKFAPDGTETPSATYVKSMNDFVSAFKKLFYCNTDTTAPTVGSMSTITNPNVMQQGKDFDLTGYWAKLQGQYSTYNRPGFNVFSSAPSDHASLMQQYVYYKSQLAVESSSTQKVDAAQGDITQLVDFSPTTGDSFLTQVMQTITTFNIQEHVNLTGIDPSTREWMNPTTDNVLDLILSNQFMNYGSSDDHFEPDSSQNQKMGLYGAFSDMAFNSYWAKAANGNGAQHVEKPEGGSIFSAINWEENTAIKGASTGDELSSTYTGVNGVITGLGTVTSSESVVMQELTANEGETVNIGQSTLKGMSEAIETYSGNQLGG